MSTEKQIENSFDLHMYGTSIGLNPHSITTYNNLGTILQESGQFAEAEQVYRRALEIHPGIAEIHCNLSNTLQSLGRFREAELSCKQALTINPHLAAAHNILGNALHKQGNLAAAEQAYRRSILLQPDYAKALNNLGLILYELDRFDEAESVCQLAIKFAPDFAIAHSNLGAIQRALSKLEESELSLQKALLLTPNNVEALNNLAVTLKEQDRLYEAIDAACRALEIDPAFESAYINLGNICEELGLFEQAATAYRYVLTINPDNGNAIFNLALIDLQTGNYSAGWQGYTRRFSINKNSDMHELLQIPLYDGSSLEGKTLFVYAEQAVGEELLFSSCINDICARAGHSVLECDHRLVPLFFRSFPSVSVIPAFGSGETSLPDDLPPADYKLPLGSLPYYVRNSLADFSTCSPWLVPDPAAIVKWQRRYAAIGNGIKVGIAWHGGGNNFVRGRKRSVTLTQFHTVLTTPDAHFVSLQYGDCSREILEIESQYGIRIHTWADADQLRNLDDFAAQVAALDLVISIDNSTAHMAGAVGCPVWCLLPFIPNWRWPLTGETSPWFPTMKLIRQSERNNWERVFSTVSELLKQFRAEKIICNEPSSPLDSIGITNNFDMPAFSRECHAF